MPSNIARGVRKVNENLLTNGRAIIITEQDKDQYSWSDIPVGSKLINTIDGTEYVKLQDQSDWVPSKIKNDGTLSIAKDSIVKIETFKIESLDEGNGHFCYTNTKGEKRHSPFNESGYVFDLEDGSYQMYRNHLDVMLDDCLIRNTITGGIEEVNPKRFILKDTLVVGEEITARYINTIRLGNPYPRIFESKDRPAEQDSEIGDLWVQHEYTMEDADRYMDADGRINWTVIKNTPTTLDGYGITDPIAKLPHTHTKSEISDFPTWIETAGIAEVANGLTGFILRLTGVITGSTGITGKSDSELYTTIDQTALVNALKTALNDDGVLNLIRDKLPQIAAIFGNFQASVGAALPLPNGCTNRAECYFMINSANSQVTLSPTGVITSVPESGITSSINYLTVWVRN